MRKANGEDRMNDMTNAAWSRVDAQMRGPLQESVRLMGELFGSALLSATFFGEVVTGGFDRLRHSVRTILVMQTVELPALRRLAASGPRLGKAGLTAPVIVTHAYVQSSLDTFPLEWLEIKQQGVTVQGPDHFSSLVVDPCHVRLQCERELKRILLGLRQALLAATGKQRAVSLIEQDALDTALRTMRGMLWLKGQREHHARENVVQEIEKIVGGRLDGIRAAMDRCGAHDWNEFDRFYADLERLMEKANEVVKS